jgi:hypothetical protein
MQERGRATGPSPHAYARRGRCGDGSPLQQGSPASPRADGTAYGTGGAAVAALLNSAHPGVDYALTTAEVIAAVNAALASCDRGTMIDLAEELDAANNAPDGCPLN